MKICWGFGPWGFFCFGSGFLWGFLFCVGGLLFTRKTRKNHFPGWRLIKSKKKMNKPHLWVAVKAPWTQWEQSPWRKQLEQELPAPLHPRKNCKNISERGEIWGENPACRYFMCTSSHLSSPCPDLFQVLPPWHSLKGELQAQPQEKPLFLGHTWSYRDFFGSSEPAGKGRGEQRAASTSCGLVAKGALCLMVILLFHSSCFQSVQKPHIIHQGTPTWAKKTLPEQNSHFWQGRAQCEHLCAWNQRIFNDKLHLLTDRKEKCQFFQQKINLFWNSF